MDIDNAAGGHIGVLELLVGAGCKTALTNDTGKTGWDLALAGGPSCHDVTRRLEKFVDAGNKTLTLEAQARASGMMTGKASSNGAATRRSKRVRSILHHIGVVPFHSPLLVCDRHRATVI